MINNISDNKKIIAFMSRGTHKQKSNVIYLILWSIGAVRLLSFGRGWDVAVLMMTLLQWFFGTHVYSIVKLYCNINYKYNL